MEVRIGNNGNNHSQVLQETGIASPVASMNLKAHCVTFKGISWHKKSIKQNAYVCFYSDKVSKNK